MVHRCCISSCGLSVRVPEAKGLSYHKFPTKESIKEQWIQAVIPHMARPELFKVVPRYTRVCSRHFRKKDYCIDAKKRARLISSAVPSVFPRKNTPLVIPTVLPVSPKVATLKTTPATDCAPGPSSSITSSPLVNTSKTVLVPSALQQNDQIQSNENEVEVNQLEPFLGRRELLIESATIQDDHLVLTVVDPATQGDLESVSISNSDDQSQASVSNKPEESGGVAKRRKRRKWNRTAFARPAKGKRKSLSKSEAAVEREPASENLSDINISAPMKIDSSGDDKFGTTEHADDAAAAIPTPLTDSRADAIDSTSLNNVTLILSDLSPSIPTYQLASVERELMESIQAVSLSCVGEPEDVNSNELHSSTSVVDSNSYSNLVPAFLHHHSSEESLFSNDESHNHEGALIEPEAPEETPPILGDPEIVAADAAAEDDTLNFDLVDLRIVDTNGPSAPPPSYFDIDELAHQLNSSLFTDGKFPLFNIENLNLSADSSSELGFPDQIFLSPDEVTFKKEDEEERTVAKKGDDATVTPPAATRGEHKPSSPRKAPSQRTRGKKQAEIPPVKEKKLKGVTKRPKKDKVIGRFSVERFKHSDKDIEYYTGFNSYRNFEAFFRSLEAYIERICITDVTYGVNHLPKTTEAGGAQSSGSTDGGNSTSKPTPEPPRKRSCQGRAMSRVNELFMTIIRLRRKLPEKVLGHMFCISQPTVSRVVRAWTVLLSKIIASYPAESSVSSSSYKEHSYPSKGLGIPDAFRDLFKSDLAKSIVVTSLNPKKVKSKSAAATSSQPHRNKKSKIEKPTTNKSSTVAKVEKPTTSKSTASSCHSSAKTEKPASSKSLQGDINLNGHHHHIPRTSITPASLTDFLLNSDGDHPVPIDQWLDFM